MLRYACQRDLNLTTPWSGPQNKRVVILGGSGFIGSNLSATLHKNGYETARCSRESLQKALHAGGDNVMSWLTRAAKNLHEDDPVIEQLSESPPNIFSVDMNVASAHSITAITKEEIGAIVDLAGPHSTRKCNTRDLFDACLGTAMMMQRAETTKSRLIEVSSSEVYFNISSESPIKEDDLDLSRFQQINTLAGELDDIAAKMLSDIELIPDESLFHQFERAISSRPYAMYKILREALAASSTARGGNVCILRPSNVFGFRDDGVTELYMVAAIQKEKLTVRSVNAIRTFIHINDLVSAIMSAMALDTAKGAFNITNPFNTTSISALAGMINTIAGNTSGIKQEYSPDTNPPQTFDISKATEFLGFHPVVSPQDGLTRMALDYFSNWDRICYL